MDLKTLALHYVTDKEITYGHNYIPGYVDLFEARRASIKKMLEIGIGLGPHHKAMTARYPNYTMAGGLKMWRDYFPNADIYGMDIYPCPVHEPRITTIVGDQGSERDLLRAVEMIGGSIDIIVDDGSHILHHQVFSFTVLSRFLTPGGIYVIEDVQSPHISSFMKLTVFSKPMQGYIRDNFHYTWYDARGKDRPHDDFMMVFIKKS